MVLVGLAMFGTTVAISSGAVSASTDLCGFTIDDTIAQKVADLGGIDQLGCPTNDTFLTPDWQAVYNNFTSGSSIYWKSNEAGAEPHLVIGAIREKWQELGWEQSALGYPTTDESTTPDGVGRYNHFEGGSIYWTPDTGAHEIQGLIRDEWASMGWEQSALGYPTTDETGTPDGVGRFNGFQGGAIYWTPDTGAHEIQGAIWDKYASLGWETSSLGYPTSDEGTTPDGVGRYNHFQNGSIYWTPDTGAVEVEGLIREKWASMGWEQSVLGYPVSDEAATPDAGGAGRVSHFQNGSIFWTPDAGAEEVHGEQWSVHATRLTALDAQEEGVFSDGDEPYMAAIQFRVTPGVPDSTHVRYLGHLQEIAQDIDDGDSAAIPDAMGHARFSGVQLVNGAALRAGQTPELVGVVSVAIESDASPFSAVDGIMNDIRRELDGLLRSQIETLSLADLLTPGLVGGRLAEAGKAAAERVTPSFWEKVGIALESFGDPDDPINVKVLVLPAVAQDIAPVVDAQLAQAGLPPEVVARSLSDGPVDADYAGDGATYRIHWDLSPS